MLTDTETGAAISGKVLDEDTTHFVCCFSKPGTYRYTLTELPGESQNYTYDESLYEIVITVTEDDGGRLDAV